MGIFNIFSSVTAERDRAPSPMVTGQRRGDRLVDELIGLCRGVLADGHVCKAEAQFLADWLSRNAAVAHVYPFNKLIERLRDALADGVLDEEEEAALLHALVGLVGGEAAGEYGSQSASRSSDLPINAPPPTPINYLAQFVVTGTFAFGPRVRVIEEITKRGGTVNTAVSKKVSYLIVGDIGSRDWIHSSYGRKIEKAVQFRDEGCPIALVSEGHWASHL